MVPSNQGLHIFPDQTCPEHCGIAGREQMPPALTGWDIP